MVFDLDGTIVNSEEQNERADRELLRRRGIEPEEEVFASFRGMGSDAVFELLRRDYGLEGSDEELLAERNRLFLDTGLDELEAYPQIVESIERLRGWGYPVAVATGSSSTVVAPMLRHLQLEDRFDTVVTADQVERGKPSPDLFAESARRLSLSPEHCVAVEDSEHGIESALGAGMMSVGVPSTEAVPLARAFYRTDLLFPDGVSTFSAELFLSWLHNTSEDDDGRSE